MKRRAELLETLKANLNPHSAVPVYVQVQELIEQAVARGELRPGDPLPTVRAVAAALGVAPNTVAKAFTALRRSGLTENRAGAGTTVAAAAWVGRLSERDGLNELQGLLRALLASGVSPARMQETLEAVLKETASGNAVQAVQEEVQTR